MSEHCEEEALPLYIDGEIQNTDEAFLQGIQETAKTLPGLAVTDDFRNGLRKRLEQEAAKPKQRVIPLWKRAAGFATAAAVIAFSVITFSNLPEPDVMPQQDVTHQAVQEESKQADVSLLADEARVVTEAKEEAVPAGENSQEASIKPRFAYTTKAELYYVFDEVSYHQAEAIVSAYEFDGAGYQVPVDEIVSVCEKLEDLTGYIGHRPSADNREATTEEEKELFRDFVWIIRENA